MNAKAERNAEWARLYAAGSTQADIARTSGVTRQAVSLVLRRLGAERPKANPRDETVAAEYAAGLTQAQIAAVHGVSRQRVHQILKGLGVKRRSRPMTRDEAVARFWSRVAFGPGCWTWTGRPNHTTGYAIIQAVALGGHRYVHHVAYELTHGAIPDGLWVLHSCDNPPCVRPDHLYAGTPKQNAGDRDSRGRGGAYKVTPEIAAAVVAATGTDIEVGARFGLSGGTVHRIRTRGVKRFARVAA